MNSLSTALAQLKTLVEPPAPPKVVSRKRKRKARPQLRTPEIHMHGPARVSFIRALRQSGNYTLDEIGQKFGVSRERIRQLEAKGGQPIRSVAPDPIRFLQVARKATSLADTAKQLGRGQAVVARTLSALGVMPALRRLWHWRLKRKLQVWTDDMLLTWLKQRADELGHMPSIQEINQTPYSPYHVVFYKRFGSLGNAARLIGHEPRALGGAGHLTQRVPHTHCKRNHEYTAANTYWYTNRRGRRYRACRECQRLRGKAAYDRQRAAARGGRVRAA